MNIVFSDIDGTFQDLGYEVPKINIEAIQSLQRKNDRFVFVTGRGLNLAEQMQTELGINCDIIFANGSGIKKVNQEVIYQNVLSLDLLEKIIPILDSENILYFVHTNHEVLMKPVAQYKKNLEDLRKSMSSIGKQGRLIMDYKTEYFEDKCFHVENVLEFLIKHPEQIILKVELMESSDQKLLSLQKKLKSPSVDIFNSFVKTLEITNPLSNKGQAIKNYLKDYSNARTFGFGDGENDLSMMEAVDVPVAVSNGSEQIKKISKYQANSCKDGGVGQFIFDNILS